VSFYLKKLPGLKNKVSSPGGVELMENNQYNCVIAYKSWIYTTAIKGKQKAFLYATIPRSKK
jgi:hypothetical protein